MFEPIEPDCTQSCLEQASLSAEVRAELEAILALLGTLEAPHFVEARGVL